MKVLVAALSCVLAVVQIQASVIHTPTTYIHPTIIQETVGFHHYLVPSTHHTSYIAFDRHAAMRHNCAVLHQVPSWALFRGNENLLFNDDDAKCYMRCYLAEMNVIRQSGQFDPAALTAQVGRAYEWPINMCAAHVKTFTDPKELASQLIRCFNDYNPEIIRQMGLLHPDY